MRAPHLQRSIPREVVPRRRVIAAGTAARLAVQSLTLASSASSTERHLPTYLGTTTFEPDSLTLRHTAISGSGDHE